MPSTPSDASYPPSRRCRTPPPATASLRYALLYLECSVYSFEYFLASTNDAPQLFLYVSPGRLIGLSDLEVSFSKRWRTT